MKARITIRLVPNLNYSYSEWAGVTEKRKDGVDEWRVTLLLQTTENQISKTTYSSHSKDYALSRAYKALEQALIHVWIDAFMAEQLVKYDHLIKLDKDFELLLWEQLGRVSDGDFTRKQFLEIFPKRVEIYVERKQRNLASKPDTLFKEPTAPIKWWQFWRGNE